MLQLQGRHHRSSCDPALLNVEHPVLLQPERLDFQQLLLEELYLAQGPVALHADLLDLAIFGRRENGICLGGLLLARDSGPDLRLESFVFVLELRVAGLQVFHVLLFFLLLLLVYRGTELLILTLKHRELLFETHPLFEMLPRLLLLATELPLNLLHIAFDVLVVDVQRRELLSQCPHLGLGLCFRRRDLGVALRALACLGCHKFLLKLFHSFSKPIPSQLRVSERAREFLLVLLRLLLHGLQLLLCSHGILPLHLYLGEQLARLLGVNFSHFPEFLFAPRLDLGELL